MVDNDRALATKLQGALLQVLASQLPNVPANTRAACEGHLGGHCASAADEMLQGIMSMLVDQYCWAHAGDSAELRYQDGTVSTDGWTKVH